MTVVKGDTRKTLMAARKADHPLQRYETRGRSPLLPSVAYTPWWDTIQIAAGPH
jgi:hypothetical protein